MLNIYIYYIYIYTHSQNSLLSINKNLTEAKGEMDKSAIILRIFKHIFCHRIEIKENIYVYMHMLCIYILVIYICIHMYCVLSYQHYTISNILTNVNDFTDSYKTLFSNKR